MITRRNRREKRYVGGVWFIGKKKCYRWRSSYCLPPLHFSCLPVTLPLAISRDFYRRELYFIHITPRTLAGVLGIFNPTILRHSTTRKIHHDWQFIFHSFSLIFVFDAKSIYWLTLKILFIRLKNNKRHLHISYLGIKEILGTYFDSPIILFILNLRLFIFVIINAAPTDSYA